MLTIFTYQVNQNVMDVVPGDMKIIQDPDAGFYKAKFEDLDVVNKIIGVIDGGHIIDDYYFCNKYNVTLPLSLLSMGAKAALLAASTSQVINCFGCGTNAIAAIISYVKSGYIAVVPSKVEYPNFIGDTTISVLIDGITFEKAGDAYAYLRGKA